MIAAAHARRTTTQEDMAMKEDPITYCFERMDSAKTDQQRRFWRYQAIHFGADADYIPGRDDGEPPMDYSRLN